LIQGFLLDRGKRVVAGCTGRLQEDDLERLRQRLGLFATQEQQTSPSRSGYRQHTDST
jgi:hypothetical protein